MQIVKTKAFIDDVESVKDVKLEIAITQRLARVAAGNFGDHGPVGGSVSELRIHYGAGYRIYYTIRGLEIVILFCAGSKSDQKKDIKRAKELAKGV